MKQQRGYFISRYDITVFRTWGQRQFKQALRQGHQPIRRREWLQRLAWAKQEAMLAQAVAA